MGLHLPTGGVLSRNLLGVGQQAIMCEERGTFLHQQATDEIEYNEIDIDS